MFNDSGAAVFNILARSRSFGNIFLMQYQPGDITFEDCISFSCYAIWIIDDVKCAIFVALIMAVAAKIAIEKNGICVW